MSTQDQKYHIYFEQNPQPMWIYEPESYQFLDVNQAAISCYGYSREEFLSMSLVDIRPVSEMERFLRYTKSGERTAAESGVWRHRKKDGSVVDVDIRRTKIDLEGQPAYLAVLIDVTNQRRSERALRET